MSELPFHIFERPSPTGWIYPCSLSDIVTRLASLPAEDVAGLWAVGLVPSTRKDKWANARYFFSDRPSIHIYSYPEERQYRLPPHTKRADIEYGMSVELQFGMVIRSEGSRFTCEWSADDLRRFIVEHVLLHEIGHHVYHRQRQARRLTYCPNTVESEQFAEAYAARHERNTP